MRFSLLVSLLTSLFIASNAHAATLNVVDGQLMGASNVLVDGNLYDVQFLDGTCIDLYNGCDQTQDFTFQTSASALLASQALLDQVFLDGPEGLFDSNPSLTNACSGHVEVPDAACFSMTPYNGGDPSTAPTIPLYFTPAVAINIHHLDTHSTDRARVPTCDIFVGCGVYPDTPTDFGRNYARWHLVPEPSTGLLLAAGLLGLAMRRRV